ncbi:hypothetical protein LY76DRAFT_610492 [Colletotrichum caudatum]|nr:hypothetical protein LY76DRAFT_610492 [Colletotrichum caudatum]
MSQHAVFLPGGTQVRENLDPLRQATSKACQYPLDLVCLLGPLADLDAVLDWRALSVGQRQLFSMAWCVVRRQARQACHGGGGRGDAEHPNLFASPLERRGITVAIGLLV